MKLAWVAMSSVVTVSAVGGFLLQTQGASAADSACPLMDRGDERYVYKNARRLLATGQDYIEYCKGGCAQSPEVQSITGVQISAPQMGGSNANAFRELIMDGKSRDIATLYVRTGSKVFTNLALLVGCPTQDMPPMLFAGNGEKAPAPIAWQELPNTIRTPASIARKY